jgi:hypothetical protein
MNNGTTQMTLTPAAFRSMLPRRPAKPRNPLKERTYRISDIDGSNKRTVTLAQYRAELDAAKKKAEAIHARNVVSIRSHKGIAPCGSS